MRNRLLAYALLAMSQFLLGGCASMPDMMITCWAGVCVATPAPPPPSPRQEACREQATTRGPDGGWVWSQEVYDRCMGKDR